MLASAVAGPWGHAAPLGVGSHTVSQTEGFQISAARQRLADELTALRSGLPRDAASDLVRAESVGAELLTRLLELGGGSVACILLTLAAQTPDGLELPSGIAAMEERIMSTALQLLTPTLRKSDLVLRVGMLGVAWLLPGSGALEARGLGRRLWGLLDGQHFRFADESLRLHCRLGLSSAGRGRDTDLGRLLVEAARNPLM